ncbi:gas vesicle protein GvpG [Actinopolymorpha alba]|uniref:gas vesicle protein GvpG n=1 Tax=Actinopolymorpha alba TaxID=533267 RepID=UPI00036A3AEE|nr:gas vesicle protein GvpG [Actinopolymorpha alba]
MGLVTGLLTLPLAPVRGTAWMMRQLIDVAEREWYDPERVRAELQALSQAFENGELTPEEFDAEEDALLDRLEEAQRRAEGV